jgi:hypothetical protein
MSIGTCSLVSGLPAHGHKENHKPRWPQRDDCLIEICLPHSTEKDIMREADLSGLSHFIFVVGSMCLTTLGLCPE